MKKKLLLSYWIALCLLSACSPIDKTSGFDPNALQTPKAIEVTQIVPQTVVVTKIIPVLITTTPLQAHTLIQNTPSPVSIGTLPPMVEIDLSKQDPLIVIVQYYTLLDLHLYEEAFNLLSTTNEWRRQNDKFKDNFIGQQKFDMKVVKVLKVIRYNDWLTQQGSSNPQVSDDWYMVSYYAEGEGQYAGANPNGIQPVDFVRVVQENKEWKIAEFSGTVHK